MDENQEILICECCGSAIDDDDYYNVEDKILCPSCYEDEAGSCNHCGSFIFAENAITDDDHFLCQCCYENYYTRCYECDRIVHNDDSYYVDGIDLCYDCNEKHVRVIREYSYKPTPILYGKGKRYLGVELEVDHGGHEDDNAEELLDIANQRSEQIYIKSDGSLDDGFEIVTHPMSLDYHLNEFCWSEILHRAVQMGYRSHQTNTCGLHVHVSRAGLGESYEEQEDTISRILYFVEQHWNELLKFSRRTESSMNRWAARHGYEHDPKALLDKAKSNHNRYVAVNLCNSKTVEFRLFRGTLRLNTLLATLQLVDRICHLALHLTDQEIQALSWSDFVSNVSYPELIQYLKERRLYVNESICQEDEV